MGEGLMWEINRNVMNFEGDGKERGVLNEVKRS